MDTSQRRGRGEEERTREEGWDGSKLLTLPLLNRLLNRHPHLCPHTGKGPPAAKAAKPNTQLLLYAGVTYVSTERNSIQLRRIHQGREGEHASGEGEKQSRERGGARASCFQEGFVSAAALLAIQTGPPADTWMLAYSSYPSFGKG